MRKLLALTLALSLLLCPASAQVALPGMGPLPFQYVSVGGGCSQATTFLARTTVTGSLATNFTTLICGMVTDGTWALMDVFYVFATDTAADAELNLMSTSYGLTQTGTVTFTANQGFTGNGSTGYLNTGWSPSTNGVQYTQNSASLGACSFTSATSSAYFLGARDVSGDSGFITASTGPVQSYSINMTTGSPFSSGTSLGSDIITRTGASAIAAYINGSSVASGAPTSVAPPSSLLYILAYDLAGTASNFYAGQLGYAFAGAGLTSTQVSNVYSRLHTFLSAVGAPTGC